MFNAEMVARQHLAVGQVENFGLVLSVGHLIGHNRVFRLVPADDGTNSQKNSFRNTTALSRKTAF